MLAQESFSAALHRLMTISSLRQTADMQSLYQEASGAICSLVKSVANDVKTLTFPPEKDDTDMRLAYLEGKKRGYTSFEIYGGTGGRSDHTFANYCLLYEMKLDGCEARLHGRSDIAYIIRNEATRGGGSSNKYISVFAFSEKASGVCIQGLKYEVTDAILQPHFPLGVSNQKTGGEYEISVSDGTLLIIEEL